MTPWMLSPALQDISNRSVGGGEFLIAQKDMVQCLAAYKSRRNLAAWLANKLFTMEEKFGSNCRDTLVRQPSTTSRCKQFLRPAPNIIYWIGWKRALQQRGRCISHN